MSQRGVARPVPDLSDAVDEIAAATKFSGVVRVDRGDTVVLLKAYGWADRAHAVANAPDTQFGIASGGKGLTALTVVSLIEQGRLELATTARSVLGADLPLINDDVTVEHLLSHRSGIGDYLDESILGDINDFVMPVPVHRLATTEEYLQVLEGHPQQSAPGERFSYCNGGYVVLALIAERCGGRAFPELVDALVCRPAGMGDTAFLRSDELPGRAAIGYLGVEGPRSNVLHLPVLGSGDGGIYSTAADMHAFWDALVGGRIVSQASVAAMVRPRSQEPSHRERYGMGFWLHESGDAVSLHGFDPGASFRSVHDPTTGVTHTVLANISSLAWPVSRRLDQLLGI